MPPPLAVRARLRRLYALAGTRGVVVLPLPLRPTPGGRIGPDPGVVLGSIVVLLAARVIGAALGLPPASVRQLPVQPAHVFERMQPARQDGTGLLAFGEAKATGHRSRECPPVDRIPLGDQRDVAAAAIVFDIVDAAQLQFVPDRAHERFVRGDHSVKRYALLLEESAEASIRV